MMASHPVTFRSSFWMKVDIIKSQILKKETQKSGYLDQKEKNYKKTPKFFRHLTPL